MYVGGVMCGGVWKCGRPDTTTDTTRTATTTTTKTTTTTTTDDDNDDDDEDDDDEDDDDLYQFKSRPARKRQDDLSTTSSADNALVQCTEVGNDKYPKCLGQYTAFAQSAEGVRAVLTRL